MGMNISKLTPLVTPLIAPQPTSAVWAEAQAQIGKVAAASGSAGTNLRGDTDHRDAPLATRQHGKAAPAAPEREAAAPATEAEGPAPVWMPEVSAVPLLALEEIASAMPGEEAAQNYGAAAAQLDQAKSFMERVSLMPEPGDLSLIASEMPPYGNRDGEREAFTLSPDAQTVARS